MSYDYQKERPRAFTETGVEMLTKIRDNARHLIELAGAFEACKTWKGVSGDTWLMMACLDYLVEKGELRRVTEKGTTWGQYEIFAGHHHD